MLTTNKLLSASTLGRWPLITGNLTLKCVGTLTKCPHIAGGRSRRGSPKAGTTVYENYFNSYEFKRVILRKVGDAENIILFQFDKLLGHLIKHYKAISCACQETTLLMSNCPLTTSHSVNTFTKGYTVSQSCF